MQDERAGREPAGDVACGEVKSHEGTFHVANRSFYRLGMPDEAYRGGRGGRAGWTDQVRARRPGKNRL